MRAFALAPIRLVGAFHRAPEVGRSVLVRQAVTLAGVGGTVKRKAWDGTRNPLRRRRRLCYFSKRAERLEMREITGLARGCRELRGRRNEWGVRDSAAREPLSTDVDKRVCKYWSGWAPFFVELRRCPPMGAAGEPRTNQGALTALWRDSGIAPHTQGCQAMLASGSACVHSAGCVGSV